MLSRELADWREAVAEGSTILGAGEWLAFRDEIRAGEWNQSVADALSDPRYVGDYDASS